MVFRAQPRRDWIDLDFKLLEAYQILDDETCPQCGNPIWLCRNDDSDIEWTVQGSKCYATARLEEHRDGKKKKEQKAKSDERKEWGVSYFPSPRVIKPRAEEGVELPTRADYYESLR